MKIDIIGKSKKLNKSAISNIVKNSLLILKPDLNADHLEIIFYSDSEIKKINKKYRDIDEATDVLSFPQIQINNNKKTLGSIAISEQTVEKYHETLEDVINHGLLHLLGYDHESDLALWQKEASKINHQINVKI